MNTNDEKTQKINALKTAYLAALKTGQELGQVARDIPAEVIMARMLGAVYRDANKSDYADWMKHNPRLARAARSVGITRSPDLRALFKGADAALIEMVSP